MCNRRVSEEVIFGTDINNNHAPIETLRENPVITFTGVSGERFGLNNKTLSKNSLFLGGIGSGKTNTINQIVDSLNRNMTNNDIMIIFDTKGDFKQKFYNPNNANHIIIGNSPEYKEISQSWNIFRDIVEKDISQINTNTREISKFLFKNVESDTQPFFALAAADIISMVIIDFIRRGINKRSFVDLNNEELVKFLKSAKRDTYLDIIERNPDFRNVEEYLGKKGTPVSNQALGVMAYISSMVNNTFLGIFGERRKKDFSIRELIRDRGAKTVFIEYDLSTGEALGEIYRLLMDLGLKEALSVRGQAYGNVYFVIDEFKLLGELNHIDNAVNFGRDRGVKILAGLQSVDQVYAIYGQERGNALLSGFSNSFCFYSPDFSTRKYVSERFGRKKSRIFSNIRGHNDVIDYEGNSVEDWDILDLKTGEAFIKLADKEPFKFKFREF